MASHDLVVPANASGLVAFAQCAGSRSPRSHRLARTLQDAGLATLQLDLLTPAEQAVDRTTHHLRFDVRLLTRRVVDVVDRVGSEPATAALPVGLLATGPGAAAALWAAVERPSRVRAVVARSGRPDLAQGRLGAVHAATLLVVGSEDPTGVRLNERAMIEMGLEATLHLVAGADEAFETPGAMDEVAALAARWFGLHLGRDQLGYDGAPSPETRSPIR